jgi:hypothetical protein
MLCLTAVLPYHVHVDTIEPTSLKVIDPLSGDKWFNFTDAPYGTTFTVNITVADVTDLFNWQIRLTWNASLLEFASASLPSDHAMSGVEMAGGILVVAGPSAGQGYVDYAVAQMGPYPWTFNGTGRLCQITLRIVHSVDELQPEAGCELAFEVGAGKTELWDRYGNPISFIPENGYYHDIWSLALTDIAVTSIEPERIVAQQGQQLEINVTLTNYHSAFGGFNVTVYVNSSALPPQTVDVLYFHSNVTLTFAWNTEGYDLGVYNITAATSLIYYDTNQSNNILSFAPVYVLDHPGDFNDDLTVNMRDIAIQCLAFGSYPGHPKWNPSADMDGNSRVDMRDISLTCMCFGATY